MSETDHENHVGAAKRLVSLPVSGGFSSDLAPSANTPPSVASAAPAVHTAVTSGATDLAPAEPRSGNEAAQDEPQSLNLSGVAKASDLSETPRRDNRSRKRRRRKGRARPPRVPEISNAKDVAPDVAEDQSAAAGDDLGQETTGRQSIGQQSAGQLLAGQRSSGGQSDRAQTNQAITENQLAPRVGSDSADPPRPKQGPPDKSTPHVNAGRRGNSSNGDGRAPPNTAPDGAVPEAPIYGALDLGTNNCRLLIAKPSRRGFRVIDAFSRIIRLGEGVGRSGLLCPEAMDRTIDALKVCATKLQRNGVYRSRLVATEACRVASNSDLFLQRARRETGLEIEVLSCEMEAQLAVSGCATLVDGTTDYVLIFDIGGGSSELIWLDLTRRQSHRQGRPVLERAEAKDCIAAWTSLPVGVVNLAEQFENVEMSPNLFERMVDHVTELLAPFENEYNFRRRIEEGSAHFLGTSGTVTTVAGIHLGLPRYDRRRVDGTWMRVQEARDVGYRLLNLTHGGRIAEPCVGRDRADLVLAGCAVLEALMRTWPCERLRVADRGLREGILATMMSEDGVYRSRRR